MASFDKPGAYELREQMQKLETVVSSILGNATHSEEYLHQQLNLYRPAAAPDITEEQFKTVLRRLSNRLSIDVEMGTGITANDFRSWLPLKKHETQWTRWLNYKRWLRNKHWPPLVLEKMDLFTDEILDYIGDPMVSGPWDRKGLIIGDVQSGKTSTYLALFNKASDVGYRLIIVLAGNTEYLRQQTQIRVDEGFLGKDSSRSVVRRGTGKVPDRLIGIGHLDKQLTYANGMTTVVQDYLQASKDATSITIPVDAREPYIFVVKKNVHVLKALIEWAEDQPKMHGKIRIPLLLLDDESDYASVNTRDEDNPTTTNNLIRQLLGRFSRSSYVAVTATPFANILINHEAQIQKDGGSLPDLFPKDFIYGLEAPDNYVGSQRTFGAADDVNTEKVVDLLDMESVLPLKHRQHHAVEVLPESLKSAIRVFVVANAIRDLRGHEERPRAMLVNVSRFKLVQTRIYELVKQELDAIKNALEAHAILYTKGVANATIDELRDAFETFYPACDALWDAVLQVLPAAVAEIAVRPFNSDTDKWLKEHEQGAEIPRRVIAVGGDVLSRGLTLEGLVTTYFYRNVRAADTMMQMARWFGYRDDFEDLCRLWIDPVVASDYRFIADAIDELRVDLRLMRRQGLTPSEFGLAIRKHPGALLITAINKSKSAAVERKIISLIGRRIETTKLDSRATVIRANLDALNQLVAGLMAGPARRGETARGYVRFSEVDKSEISWFVETYEPHATDELLSGNAVSKFIKNNPNPKFATWDVVLVNGAKKSKMGYNVSGISIHPPTRAVKIGSLGELLVSGRSSRLAGGDDLRKLLSAGADAEATEKFRKENPGKAIPEGAYYPYLPRPVLMVYVLKPDLGAHKPGENHLVENLNDTELVAIKLAFPGDRTNVRSGQGDVEYLINTVAQQTWFVEYSGNEDNEDV